MKSARASRPRALIGVLALILSLVPFAGTAVANHVDRTLNLVPEKKNNRTNVHPNGDRHTIIGRLSSPADALSGPINIDFEIDGPSDPGPTGPGSGTPESVNASDGNTPETPDRTCTVEVGMRECEVFYRGLTVGTDEIRGWIDHDGMDSTVEADLGEGPDENAEPGDQPEPDGTDVVLTRWFEGLPPGPRLDCEPERATVFAGLAHTVTCTLENSKGLGFGGWLIDGENLRGANDPDDAGVEEPENITADYDDICTTDASGHCQFDVAAVDNEIGEAELCFWVDEDNDSSFHQTPPWDGSKCDEGVDAEEKNNTTDVISVAWVNRLSSRSVTLASSKRTVGFGRKVTLSGSVGSGNPACSSGVEVAIERDAAGDASGFERIGTVTTTTDGSYSFVEVAERSAGYRAVVEGSPECEMDSSDLAQVDVRKRVHLKASRNPVPRGRLVKLRVEVLGCDGRGDKVVLLKRIDGEMKNRGRKATNDNCRAVFKKKIMKKSAFQVRSPQNADYLAGTSRLLRVRVK